MSKFSKLLPALALAAALAPLAAEARPNPAPGAPAQHLIFVAHDQDQASHGRIAQNANVPAGAHGGGNVDYAGVAPAEGSAG